MTSAAGQFLSLLPNTLGLGPHSIQLISEAQRALKGQNWVTVIILSATIIDVIRHEDSIFDLNSAEDEDGFGGGYFESGGYDYLTSAERKKLEWLRHMRNQIVHYEGPIEGMMGRRQDDGILRGYADKAVSALLPVLKQD